jgi:hypothetical protein
VFPIEFEERIFVVFSFVFAVASLPYLYLYLFAKGELQSLVFGCVCWIAAGTFLIFSGPSLKRWRYWRQQRRLCHVSSCKEEKEGYLNV